MFYLNDLSMLFSIFDACIWNSSRCAAVCIFSLVRDMNMIAMKIPLKKCVPSFFFLLWWILSFLSDNYCIFVERDSFEYIVYFVIKIFQPKGFFVFVICLIFRVFAFRFWLIPSWYLRVWFEHNWYILRQLKCDGLWSISSFFFFLCFVRFFGK